ncbi:MAG: hypothetical protein JJU11_00745 [Candidatus Sumerlaeia bacterium]|nr:hypothetical protein [Candidatus Sumerlaeia bacterium]
MADMEAVKKEIYALRGRLDEQVARAKRQQTITLVIGVLLIVFVLGYFQWIKGQLGQMLDEKTLAQIASSFVQDKVPEVRSELESMAIEMTPEMVDNIVNNLISTQLPSYRRNAVSFVKRETGSRLDEFNKTLDIALDELLQSYEEDITRLLTELDTDEGRDALEEEVYSMIVASLEDSEIRDTMAVYLDGIRDVNDRLTWLSEAEEAELHEAEKPVRNLIAAIREMAERSTMDFAILDMDSEIFKPIEVDVE